MVFFIACSRRAGGGGTCSGCTTYAFLEAEEDDKPMIILSRIPTLLCRISLKY
jgi:hypothetical protein